MIPLSLSPLPPNLGKPDKELTHSMFAVLQINHIVVQGTGVSINIWHFVVKDTK